MNTNQAHQDSDANKTEDDMMNTIAYQNVNGGKVDSPDNEVVGIKDNPGLDVSKTDDHAICGENYKDLDLGKMEENTQYASLNSK